MHMRFRNIYPTTEIDQGYLRKIYVKHFSKKCKTWLEAINYNLHCNLNCVSMADWNGQVGYLYFLTSTMYMKDVKYYNNCNTVIA